LQYVATLFIQSAIGLVVAIWPHEASGQTSATAYAMAFMVPIALQLAALVWFLFPRSERPDGAQSVREIAVAFSSLRSASQSLVNNLRTFLHNLTQRRGAARVQHQVQGLSEPPSLPGGLPADTAAPPAAPAAEPADTADARAETVAASTDAAVEPTGGLVAAGKTTVSPTEAALRSILNAPLGVGLGGALDTTLSASAGRSKRAALAPGTDIDQPAERGLSFPLIAPSHVQALNAVYRRRPPLAATIGGLQASILAAWPPPDRRADASHRVSLRLDGEPGELWLPQSLLDVLVGSVDPALSLHRLGPNRAAIILEFALDSVLAAVEMNLGCKVAIESFSGQAERRESDGQLPLFFTLVIEGRVTTGCELRLPPDYALRLAEGLDRHAGISRSVLDLPVPVYLRVAAANLAAGEIERLSPEDVVLVDASCQPGHAGIAVVGERFVAPVALAPEGYRLAAHPIPGAASPWAWSLPTDAIAVAREADAETDNRPLHVLFEIGSAVQQGEAARAERAVSRYSHCKTRRSIS
jgi:hypothetical protein